MTQSTDNLKRETNGLLDIISNLTKKNLTHLDKSKMQDMSDFLQIINIDNNPNEETINEFNSIKANVLNLENASNLSERLTQLENNIPSEDVSNISVFLKEARENVDLVILSAGDISDVHKTELGQINERINELERLSRYLQEIRSNKGQLYEAQLRSFEEKFSPELSSISELLESTNNQTLIYNVNRIEDMVTRLKDTITNNQTREAAAREAKNAVLEQEANKICEDFSNSFIAKINAAGDVLTDKQRTTIIEAFEKIPLAKRPYLLMNKDREGSPEKTIVDTMKKDPNTSFALLTLIKAVRKLLGFKNESKAGKEALLQETSNLTADAAREANTKMKGP